ncbi:MAG TPA: beta-ketoacyl-ACP synthase III [Planctomycetota bacterium]|nr:beta-ketoacyl-ACP synthase III [Planctomycetota bacterium]
MSGAAVATTLARAAIAGTGSAVPARVVTNADIARSVETDDAWIVTRTGIRERRVVEGAGPGEANEPRAGATTALSVEAARKALEAAELAPADVELVVVGTCTPDYPSFPATAPLVARELGATRAFGFDLSLACTGFIAALMTAQKFLAARAASNALVIGADVMSGVTDWTDRNTCVIFADGAGAAVLRRAEPGAEALRGEVLYASLSMQGDSDVLLVDPRSRKIRMKGRETFKFAVQRFVGEIERAAASVGKRPADLSAVIPHQVNQRIIEAAAERLEIPLERIVVNIDRYGNTSAGSVPIALDEAVRAGRLKPGDLACLVAFGAGLSWGAALVRW